MSQGRSANSSGNGYSLAFGTKPRNPRSTIHSIAQSPVRDSTCPRRHGTTISGCPSISAVCNTQLLSTVQIVTDNGWYWKFIYQIDIQSVKKLHLQRFRDDRGGKNKHFFIWQNFGLCTVLPVDGLTGRWLDFRHNMHRLVLFVLLCLQQVERVITVSTNTCYDKYSKCVCIYYPFSCHRIPAMLKCVYVFTTWRFLFVVVHCTQLIHHRWLSTR